MSVILGSGKGFLFITLFTSLRSTKDLSEPSGLDIVNIGQAHSEWLIFLNTPYSHNRFISSLSLFSWKISGLMESPLVNVGIHIFPMVVQWYITCWKMALIACDNIPYLSPVMLHT